MATHDANTVTFTVSRTTARAIIEAMDRTRISASAHRHPHIVAHRAAAEAAAVRTAAEYREVLDALADAFGIEREDA